MARVLVLRAAAAGRGTAERLLRDGHEPLLLPLQEVVRLDPACPPGPFGGFIATSAEAAPWVARHAAGRGLPILAVGASTARALREAGAEHVLTGEGRAVDLVARVAALGPEVHPFVYAAGRVRLPDLEDGLTRSGVAFLTVEVYDMVDRPVDEREVEALVGSSPPGAVLLLSRRQAELFGELAKRFPALLPVPMRHLCLSEAIAARLHPDRRGEWPVRPDLDLVLAMLR